MQVEAAGILTRCPIFRRVQGQSLDRLLTMAMLREFGKGEQLIRQGDPCPGVYIVGSGMVRIYKIAASGKEHVLHLATPGQTLLEVASILDMDCPAFGEAIEPSRCVLLPNGAFRKALAEDHALCLQLLGGMALRVRQFVGLLEDIVLRDALSRVAKYLLETSREGEVVTLPSLKKHLASHLNLTSETLSRCLRQLLDEGLIESSEAQEIRIADREMLQEAAEGMYPRI
jgi:CRP/FNR family transcriptional regulator